MSDCTTDDGVRISYDSVGSGPAVVFVHGITDNRGLWEPLVEQLAGSYRCLTLDLRGHGQSGDAADYSALSMARDLAAVVADAGLERPHVVGHSLGGVVVTAYGANAPVASVVNVDQPLRFSDLGAALVPLEAVLRGPGFHEVLAAVFASLEGDRLPAARSARLARHRQAARQDVVLGVWEPFFNTPPGDLDALAADLVRRIPGPYLSLHGLPLAPGYAEWLSELKPDVLIEEWEGDGHYAHLVEPDRFVARLRGFLGS